MSENMRFNNIRKCCCEFLWPAKAAFLITSTRNFQAPLIAIIVVIVIGFRLKTWRWEYFGKSGRRKEKEKENIIVNRSIFFLKKQVDVFEITNTVLITSNILRFSVFLSSLYLLTSWKSSIKRKRKKKSGQTYYKLGWVTEHF